jgi:hypothetical protein
MAAMRRGRMQISDTAIRIVDIRFQRSRAQRKLRNLEVGMDDMPSGTPDSKTDFGIMLRFGFPA